MLGVARATASATSASITAYSTVVTPFSSLPEPRICATSMLHLVRIVNIAFPPFQPPWHTVAAFILGGTLRESSEAVVKLKSIIVKECLVIAFGSYRSLLYERRIFALPLIRNEPEGWLAERREYWPGLCVNSLLQRRNHPSCCTHRLRCATRKRVPPPLSSRRFRRFVTRTYA